MLELENTDLRWIGKASGGFAFRKQKEFKKKCGFHF